MSYPVWSSVLSLLMFHSPTPHSGQRLCGRNVLRIKALRSAQITFSARKDSLLTLCPLRPLLREGCPCCTEQACGDQMHQVGALLSCVRGSWASPVGETAPWRDQTGNPWTCGSHTWKSRRQLQTEQSISTTWGDAAPHLLSYQKLQAYQILPEWTFAE